MDELRSMPKERLTNYQSINSHVFSWPSYSTYPSKERFAKA